MAKFHICDFCGKKLDDVNIDDVFEILKRKL